MRTEGKARSGKDLGFCLREAGATGACVGEGQHRTDLAVRVLPLAMCEGRAEPWGLWQNPQRRGRLAGRGAEEVPGPEHHEGRATWTCWAGCGWEKKRGSEQPESRWSSLRWESGWEQV